MNIPESSVTCLVCGKKGIHEECCRTNNWRAIGTESRVCDDICERQARGINKYGQTVSQNPLILREWLQHAYEEALDMAIYLKRAIEKIDGK